MQPTGPYVKSGAFMFKKSAPAKQGKTSQFKPKQAAVSTSRTPKSMPATPKKKQQPPAKRQRVEQAEPEEEAADQPSAPQGQGESKVWSEEKFQAAKDNQVDIYYASLSPLCRVKAVMFGGKVGIDIRRYMEAKFGSDTIQEGQLLPTNKGVRLTIPEYDALKEAIAEMDHALQLAANQAVEHNGNGNGHASSYN